MELINNEELLQDMINVNLRKMKKDELKKKYLIGDKKYKKIKYEFVTKYGVDPRILFQPFEIDNNEELKQYCSDEKIDKTINELKQEVKTLNEKRLENMVVTKRSTLYDGEGNTRLVWIGEKADEQAMLNGIVDSIKTLASEIQPAANILISKDYSIDENLMVFLPIVDLHLGLKIDPQNVSHGFAWDLDIAEAYYTKAMNYLLSNAPAAKQLVLFDGGDLMHAHDNTNKTIKSGHNLDTSEKYEKVMLRLFEMMKATVAAALTKFEEVYFYSVPGNHNDFISITLKAILKEAFRDNPRFKCSLDKYTNVYYHRFGNTIIGMSHGDEIKPEKANDVLVSDNIDVISNYKYFDFYFGHFHQNKFIEKGLTTVRCLKPLIPTDRWADGIGFRNRDVGFAQYFLYSENGGMISNVTYRDN